MNPFEQGLDIEPAFPQGFPARGTAAAPSQVASTAGNGVPTLWCGQCGGGYLGQYCHDLHQVGRQDLACQAHRRGCQQSQQAAQGFVTLQLAQLDAAAGFEALMIVLHDPTRTKSSPSFPFSLPYQRSEQPCRLLHRCYVLSS